MSIWQNLNGQKFVSAVKLKTWRIVEDQSRSTTRKFVSSVKEHEILEQLLDQHKPRIKYYNDEHFFQGLHYLLFTPFRYPPLKHGSRFGSRLERNLLYGSFKIQTAMSEKAFYKLSFLNGSSGELGSKSVSYTAFQINIESENFIDLSKEPFNRFESTISSKNNYLDSQTLGSQMRLDNVESFSYKSARCNQGGINMGVFSPKALQNNQDLEATFEHLNCYATREIVEFSYKSKSSAISYCFPIDQYLISGQLPMPSP